MRQIALTSYAQSDICMALDASRGLISAFHLIRIWIEKTCARARLFSGGTSMLRSMVLRRIAALFPVMVILAVAILFSAQASAQVSGAALSGSITDPSG